MAFSYSATWDDTVRMARETGHLLTPVAAAFVFLPAALLTVLFPEPRTENPALIFSELMRHYGTIWHWVLLRAVIGMIGTAAILRLVLVRGTSVADAIMAGARILPFYFLLSVASGLMIGVGLLLLIVPGLYLIGRIVPAASAMIGENRANPMDAIGRSFEITRGNGWGVLGLVLIVGIVGALLIGVTGTMLGIVLLLAAGPETGAVLVAVVGAALDTLYGVLLLLLYAAIYRALAARQSVGETFD